MKKNSDNFECNKISKFTNVIFSIIFILLALICIIPTIFSAIISFSSEDSIRQVGFSFLPIEWSVNAYNFIFMQFDVIFRAFGVSAIITILGTLIGLVLISTMAYVISRPTYKYRRFFSIFILIPMLFNGGLVANYMIVTQVLHLKDTIWAMILPIAVSSFYVIVMKTFFQTTIPDSVIESAKIDGASQLKIFSKIVMPLSLPGLATIGLLLTFRFWNEWFQPMLYLDSAKLFPLQYVLISIERDIEFITTNSALIGSAASGLLSDIPSETTRMALVVIVVLPIACVYPFFQKYFVSGLTVGAVKG